MFVLKKLSKRLSALSLAALMSLSFFTPFSATVAAQAEEKAQSKLSDLLNKLQLAGQALPQDLSNNESLVKVLVELRDVTPATLEQGDKEAYKTVYREAAALQDGLLASLAYQGVNLTVESRTALLANAFSTTVKAKDLPLLAAQEDVVRLHQNYPTIARPTSYEESARKRRSRSLSDQYAGQGQLVAIIDSGFDVEHPDMKISDDKLAMYPDENSIKARMDEIYADLGVRLLGIYRNSKFPYAFNYADNDMNVYESGDSHGMHVAGIVAANGKVKGQVPEAQLLAMRVFADGSGSTSASIYLTAMEHSILLGASSLNMSLGADFGSLNLIDPAVTAAIEKAKQLGAIVAVAAGNSNYSGDSNGQPKPENPDYSIVSSPAVAVDSLAVASINSPRQMQRVFEVIGVDGLTKAPYNLGQSKPLDEYNGQEFEVVYAGLGTREEVDRIGDMSGKIALIERGSITFSEKSQNVASKGAKMALVYQNATDSAEFVGMMLENVTIPTVSIRRKDALLIKARLEAKQSVKMKPLAGEEEVEYADANYASNFSSWGPTPEFDLKPEIAAYGGNVYSTLPDGRYGNMSGTSMATPQIAGMIAAVNQRLDADQKSGYIKETSKEERYYLIKNILMSTAEPVKGKDSNLYSPRKQGAGLANKESALRTYVYASNQSEPALAKLNLGAVGNTLELKVRLNNFSIAKEASFSPEIIVQTDKVDAAEGYVIPAEAQVLTTESPAQVLTVAAGASTDFNYTVDISASEAALLQTFTNGYYVEGFIRFRSSNSDFQPDLVIPFIAFHGKKDAEGNATGYTDLPVLEKPVYEFGEIYKDGSHNGPINHSGPGVALNAFTALTSEADGEEVVLGEIPSSSKSTRKFDAEEIYFSPNSDGVYDKLTFQGVFTKAAYDDQARVLTADGKELWKAEQEAADLSQGHIPKSVVLTTANGADYSRAVMSAPSWTFDGAYRNEEGDETQIKDGKYIYEFSAVALHAPEAPKPAPYVVKIPFKVDKTAPKYLSVEYLAGQLVIKGEDPEVNGVASKLSSLYFVPRDENGKEVLDQVQQIPLNAAGIGTLELPQEKLHGAYLSLIDNAGNSSEYELNELLNEGKAKASLQVTFVEDKTGDDGSVSEVPVEFKSQYPDDRFVVAQDKNYFLEVRDAKNFIVNDLTNLPEGQYTYTLKLNVSDYELADPAVASGSFSVTAATPKLELRFKLRALDTSDYIDVELLGIATPANPELLYRFKITNLDSGREYNLKADSNSLFAQMLGLGWMTKIKLPEGRYRIEIVEINLADTTKVVAVEPTDAIAASGQYFEFDSLRAQVKHNQELLFYIPESDAARFGFNLKNEPQGSVKATVTVEKDGDINLPDEFSFVFHNGQNAMLSTKKADGVYEISGIAPGRYLLIPYKLPAEYYVEQGYQLVEVLPDAANNFTYKISVITDDKMGLVKVKSIMREKTEKQLAPEYEFKNILEAPIKYEKVSEDKAKGEVTYKVPFGESYMFLKSGAEGYTALPKSKSIKLSKDKPEIEVEIYYARPDRAVDKATLTIDTFYPNSEAMFKDPFQENLIFEIKNVATGEKFNLTVNKGEKSNIDVPYGDYVARVTNLDARMGVDPHPLSFKVDKNEVKVEVALTSYLYALSEPIQEGRDKTLIMFDRAFSTDLPLSSTRLHIEDITETATVTPALGADKKAEIYKVWLYDKSAPDEAKDLPQGATARLIFPGDYADYPVEALTVLELDASGNVIATYTPYLVKDPTPAKANEGVQRVAININHVGTYALVQPINKPNPEDLNPVKTDEDSPLASKYNLNGKDYKVAMDINPFDDLMKIALRDYRLQSVLESVEKSETLLSEGDKVYKHNTDIFNLDLSLVDEFGAKFRLFPNRVKVTMFVEIPDLDKYDLEKSKVYYKDPKESGAAALKEEQALAASTTLENAVKFEITHLSNYVLYLVEKERTEVVKPVEPSDSVPAEPAVSDPTSKPVQSVYINTGDADYEKINGEYYMIGAGEKATSASATSATAKKNVSPVSKTGEQAGSALAVTFIALAAAMTLLKRKQVSK